MHEHRRNSNGEALPPRTPQSLTYDDKLNGVIAMEWKPINTAPTDGTIIDVWLGDADAEDAAFYCGPNTRRASSWHFREGRFRPYMGLGLPVVTVRPTHWMPLPNPPRDYYPEREP